tara:strand:- start:51 stop:368 length:318 start_codon:yes stop_codon:yes gene_type:complete
MAKHRWNISKERGKRLIYNSIVNILSKQPNHSLEIKKLRENIYKNLKNVKITYNNQPKDIFNYIKNNLGGLIHIIDSHGDICISDKAGERIIHYLDPLLDEWEVV